MIAIWPLLQGRPVMKIVYRPESESDRSSLNSEEKALYDELQRELLELRRNMRHKEQENSKKVSALVFLLSRDWSVDLDEIRPSTC